MSQKPNPDELDLNDEELTTVLKNHGVERRSILKAVGVGTGLATLGGTVAASEHDEQDNDGSTHREQHQDCERVIHEVYGATYADDVDQVPLALEEYGVELHTHPGDATHEGFPQGDDTTDADPETEGMQGDEDDQDDVPEFFFDPVGLHVKPGEIVGFRTHDPGLHTVTSFHPKFNEPPMLVFPNRVPTDHGFTSPPIAEDDTWIYEFTEKGVYDVLCLPHVSFGMVMRIVVFDPHEDDIESETFAEPEEEPDAPLPPAAGMVLTDKKLDPKHIVDAGEVAWSDITLPGFNS